MAFDLALAPNEFAFRFGTEEGIGADQLATFLQRAATVARRAQADLVVVGVSQGSLIVKLKAISKAVRKEFKRAPVATSASSMAVGAVVVAIVTAMTPSGNSASPMAKAGADLVVEHQMATIEIITIDAIIRVMDEQRAAIVRRARDIRKSTGKLISAAEQLDTGVQRLAKEARQGLSGDVLSVEGQLYFRPDGYHYLVPISPTSGAYSTLESDRHFRVKGLLVELGGQPDKMIIDTAFLD